MSKMKKKVINTLWFMAISMCTIFICIWCIELLASGLASNYWFGEIRCWIGIISSSAFLLLMGPKMGDYALEVLTDGIAD